jgi:hypothetical protein
MGDPLCGYVGYDMEVYLLTTYPCWHSCSLKDFPHRNEPMTHIMTLDPLFFPSFAFFPLGLARRLLLVTPRHFGGCARKTIKSNDLVDRPACHADA